MIIRDCNSRINGDDTTYTMPSGGIDIVSDDGRTLFSIRLEEGSEISVWSGDFCKHNNKILSDRFVIVPRSGNVVTFRKLEHDTK